MSPKNKTKNNADLEPVDKIRYFAGANTSHGFVNYYPDVFNRDKFKRLYVIKGGSGTGKNFLMQSIAKEAEKMGVKVEYYHCASDPNSLDGIILGDNIVGVIDGTAPHITDPEYPGAIDEIINVGDFWNDELLIAKRDEIVSISKTKSRAFKYAYQYLKAYADVADHVRELLSPLIEHGKMRAAINRITKKYPDGEGFTQNVRMINAIGMGGTKSFDTYKNIAKQTYIITEFVDTAQVFLSAIVEKAKNKEWQINCSYSAIEPMYLSAVYIKDIDVAFVVSDERPEKIDSEIIVNMERFVDVKKYAKIRQKIRFGVKCKEMLIEGALMHFEEAKEMHQILEKIYIKAMDFDRKEAALEPIKEIILSYLK